MVLGLMLRMIWAVRSRNMESRVLHSIVQRTSIAGTRIVRITSVMGANSACASSRMLDRSMV